LTVLENLALACKGCNGHKYNKINGIDPLTLTLERLYNPRNDIWNEHFAWDKDPTLVIGLTSIGRTTIEVLKLNRLKLIHLRALLMKFSEHPPVD
jgi:hypothetical protein